MLGLWQIDPASIVLAIVGVTTLVVAAVYAVRFSGGMKAASDAAAAWKRERDAELAHRERLERELTEAQEKINLLQAQVADLQARPDLRRLETMMDRNYEQVTARHERILAVLDLIAAKVNTP